MDWKDALKDLLYALAELAKETARAGRLDNDRREVEERKISGRPGAIR